MTRDASPLKQQFDAIIEKYELSIAVDVLAQSIYEKYVAPEPNNEKGDLVVMLLEEASEIARD